MFSSFGCFYFGAAAGRNPPELVASILNARGTSTWPFKFNLDSNGTTRSSSPNCMSLLPYSSGDYYTACFSLGIRLGGKCSPRGCTPTAAASGCAFLGDCCGVAASESLVPLCDCASWKCWRLSEDTEEAFGRGLLGVGRCFRAFDLWMSGDFEELEVEWLGMPCDD